MVRALLIALGILAMTASPAGASCAVPDPPAERLASFEAAFAGTVIGRSDTAIRFRVDRAVKGDLGSEIEIPNPMTSVQIGLQPGDRTGLFLYRDRGSLVSNDCLRTGYGDLLAAAVPAPCKPGAKVARTRLDGRRRVVGCGKPPRGAGFQIVGWEKILTLVPLPGGGIVGAGDALRPGREAIDVDGAVRRFVTGSADWGTQGVVVRYRRRGGGEGSRQAALVPIAGKRTLRRLGAKERFVQWGVQLPRRATPLEAVRHGFGGSPAETVDLGFDRRSPASRRAVAAVRQWKW